MDTREFDYNRADLEAYKEKKKTATLVAGVNSKFKQVQEFKTAGDNSTIERDLERFNRVSIN